MSFEGMRRLEDFYSRQARCAMARSARVRYTDWVVPGQAATGGALVPRCTGLAAFDPSRGRATTLVRRPGTHHARFAFEQEAAHLSVGYTPPLLPKGEGVCGARSAAGAAPSSRQSGAVDSLGKFSTQRWQPMVLPDTLEPCDATLDTFACREAVELSRQKSAFLLEVEPVVGHKDHGAS